MDIHLNITSMSETSHLHRDGRASLGRVLLEHKPVQIADVLADPDYRLREVQRLGGFRTHLGLPLLRESDAIGILIVSRATVQPFDDKHIALLTTFADQAVVAIENTRLFEAEQQRTRELSELLEQQTATSGVLQVISSSPGDLQPVFETMLHNAVRICDAKFGNIFRWEGDALHLVATHNIPPAFAELRRRSPFSPGPENPIGRMVATKAVVQVADLAAEQRYIDRRDPAIVAAVELGGIRTFVAVPMLKENELIGALIVYRQEVRPFTDKQIELVTTFADQAVIAIENTRLLNELREVRWNSRLPHRRCSTLSAAQHSISTRCSKPWSRVRSGCAELSAGSSTVSTARCFEWLRSTTPLRY